MPNNRKVNFVGVNISLFLVKETDFVESLTLTNKIFNLKSLIVVDELGHLKGIITDGDLKAYRDMHLTEPVYVHEAMNSNPFFVRNSNKFLTEDVLNFEASRGVVPVVNDENKVVDAAYVGELPAPKSETISEVYVGLAPLRISFGGGGTDTSYWFKNNSGKVVNAAIAKYARVFIKKRSDKTVTITDYTGTRSTTIDKLSASQSDIIIAGLKKFNLKLGVEVTIVCDAPNGSGLGGSSSVCTALIKALCLMFDINLTNKEVSNLAYSIERIDAQISGGWQDQIASSYGGFLTSNFSALEISTVKMDIDNKVYNELISCLFLIRAGTTRDGSSLHNDFERSVENSDFQHVMKQIKMMGVTAEKMFLAGNIQKLPNLFNKSWELKKLMSKKISNPNLDKFAAQLGKWGSSGTKLLGAGGGGYFLAWVNLPDQHNFLEKLSDNQIEFERIIFDHRGAVSWKIKL